MRTKSTITATEFVEIWQKSNSVDEVAEATGFGDRTCSQRACNYRKKGVKLKKMKGGGHEPPDWTSLAKLAEKLSK